MKRQNLQLKNYHCIPKKGHYDFIPPGSDAYDALHLRVVKFPISDNSYEYLVTNLEPHAYPLDTVKELYRIRWGIETAFRHLKYAGSMVHLHSIKKDKQSGFCRFHRGRERNGNHRQKQKYVL